MIRKRDYLAKFVKLKMCLLFKFILLILFHKHVRMPIWRDKDHVIHRTVVWMRERLELSKRFVRTFAIRIRAMVIVMSFLERCTHVALVVSIRIFVTFNIGIAQHVTKNDDCKCHNQHQTKTPSCIHGKFTSSFTIGTQQQFGTRFCCS